MGSTARFDGHSSLCPSTGFRQEDGHQYFCRGYAGNARERAYSGLGVYREAATSRRTPKGLTQRNDQNGRGSRAFQAYRAGGGGRQIGYPAMMERATVGDSGNDWFVISKIGDAN